MSENVTPGESVKPEASSYWSWRRRIAFAFMQLSLLAYALGVGAYGTCYVISHFYGGADREISIVQALPIFAVLYAIAGLMIVAVLFAVIALIFSRRALYLAILYVPTGVYAYYTLSV